jgi:hypothetical protein
MSEVPQITGEISMSKAGVTKTFVLSTKGVTVTVGTVKCCEADARIYSFDLCHYIIDL